MGLLQEKLKGVDVEPVCGSKCDVYETESVSIFDHGMGIEYKDCSTGLLLKFKKVSYTLLPRTVY